MMGFKTGLKKWLRHQACRHGSKHFGMLFCLLPCLPTGPHHLCCNIAAGEADRKAGRQAGRKVGRQAVRPADRQAL